MTTVTPVPAAPVTTAGTEMACVLDAYRGELRAHCRGILRSSADADDAVQETMIRAWRRLDGFEHRSSLRTWLYRIATNVCLDQVRSRARRPVPADVEPGADASAPDLAAPGPGPDEAAATGDAVRRALLAAITHLPPGQRAALVLYEVFRWPATDVAALLGTTTAAVTSSVQRARATLARCAGGPGGRAPTAEERRLADRYVDAFGRYDVAALLAAEHDPRR